MELHVLEIMVMVVLIIIQFLIFILEKKMNLVNYQTGYIVLKKITLVKKLIYFSINSKNLMILTFIKIF